MFQENKLLEIIIGSLLKVDGWVESNQILEHKHIGFSVWIANVPVIDTNFHPEPIRLSLFEKYRLWRAATFCINKLRVRKLEKKIDRLQGLIDDVSEK